jgi:regulatory protein
VQKEDLKRATDIALRYLSLKSRTIAEVKKKLLEKEFDELTINCVIDKLVDWHFVDDVQFSKNFIVDSQIGKPKGSYRLRMELMRKGVPKEIISEALEMYLTPESESDLAILAATKKMKSLTNYPKDKQFKRLMSFLIARGFSLDKAKSATAQILDKSAQ